MTLCFICNVQVLKDVKKCIHIWNAGIQISIFLSEILYLLWKMKQLTFYIFILLGVPEPARGKQASSHSFGVTFSTIHKWPKLADDRQHHSTVTSRHLAMATQAGQHSYMHMQIYCSVTLCEILYNFQSSESVLEWKETEFYKPSLGVCRFCNGCR